MARAIKHRGFFGGTFDPPHFGHIHLVLSVLEEGKVDEVVVCPTAFSTTKPGSQIVASPEDRLEMVKLAFSDIPSVLISEEEIFQPGPVYTIDTLRSLQSQFSDMEWSLIVGEDLVSQISSWEEGEDLIKEFSLIVCPRHSLDISSTKVRDRIRKNLFCEHLVRRKVLDFIRQKSLY